MGRILVLKRAELRTVQASASVVPPATTVKVAGAAFKPMPTLPLASIVNLSGPPEASKNASRGSLPPVLEIVNDLPLLVLSIRIAGEELDKCSRLLGLVVPMPALPELPNDITAVPGPSAGMKSNRLSA